MGFLLELCHPTTYFRAQIIFSSIYKGPRDGSHLDGTVSYHGPVDLKYDTLSHHAWLVGLGNSDFW